ncbi:hypothetical protein GF327_07915, partial [Candidatus Woesearchaeota archaeon]|nr:hypothetical protein [Candidatus Woesearchaeota archaeon]
MIKDSIQESIQEIVQNYDSLDAVVRLGTTNHADPKSDVDIEILVSESYEKKKHNTLVNTVINA